MVAFPEETSRKKVINYLMFCGLSFDFKIKNDINDTKRKHGVTGMVFRIVSRLAEPVDNPKGVLPILRGIGRVR